MGFRKGFVGVRKASVRAQFGLHMVQIGFS